MIQSKPAILLPGLLLLFLTVDATEIHQDFTDRAANVEFVMKAIPSGSLSIDKDALNSNDSPFNQSINHQVHIDAFYLAETETTWALYEACIQDKSCRNNDPDGGDNDWGKGQYPVIEVSWHDVNTEFIPWLNQLTDKKYRLPTEDEWEYAAKGGGNSPYQWGQTINCGQARYGFMDQQCPKVNSTKPVKSYLPNAFGLYDMHGNVWEFVQDCWTEPRVPAALAASSLPCKEIVIKGGSWLNTAEYLRATARYHHNRTYRESGDGFRLALDAQHQN